MAEQFRDIMEYHKQCNAELIHVCLASGSERKGHIGRILSHLLNAHHIWNARINESKPVYGAWDLLPSDRWLDINGKNFEETKVILLQKDLCTKISYLDLKGRKRQNTILDMLYQIANHTSHHRGQLTLLCREAGLEPGVKDYIFFQRDRP